VIAEGTPGQLKAATGADTLRIRLAEPAQRPLARRTLAGLLRAPVHERADPVLLTATVPAARSGRPPSEQAGAAVTGLGRAGVSVGEFALGQPSLDEVFLALTGQHAAGSTQAATGSQGAAGAPATTKGSS
jgi:daunorubicin/doxorubicin transport system ATP-binding protein